MPPEGLRVAIADDHYLVREGTRRLLESAGVQVVASVADGEALLEAVEAHRPDAVLTDVRMPPSHRTEGIEVAQKIRRRFPEIGVVVLSQHADEGYVIELLRDGVAGYGYLLKERVGDRDELVRALRETAAGGSVVDPVLVEALVRRRSAESASPLRDLTPRELEVLREMAQGKSNAAVAASLSLSESSVEKYTNVIFSKLGLGEEPALHRRVAAVIAFLREQGF